MGPVAYRGRGPGGNTTCRKKGEKVFHEGAGPWEENQQAKKRPSTNKRKKHPLRHRERGALESAGPVAYANFATRLIRHWV